MLALPRCGAGCLILTCWLLFSGMAFGLKEESFTEEGQIRAEAVVRHAKPGRGLGLEFTALTEEDGPRLTALMTRFRSSSQSRTNSK